MVAKSAPGVTEIGGGRAPDVGDATGLSVGFLGPLRIVTAGAIVTLGRPMAKLLLARLALGAPGAVTASALVDALWDEDPPPTAAKTLQKYVSELRKSIGPACVRTADAGYSLEIAPDRVDLHLFYDLLDRARAARAQERMRRAWELYEDALGLWRGDLFSGLPDVGFVIEEATRAENARTSALEEQMETGLALGKHESLVLVLEDLVGRFPLRERLWAALMTALYRSGRQADALAAYRRARGILLDELGIEPSPELSGLEEKILLHDPSLDPPEAPEVAGNLPTTHTSFVGRSDEMAELTRLLATTRLITLTGPGGSGKTRLAVETGARAQGLFRDGVWFVDLAVHRDDGEVIVAAAAALGIAPEPNETLERTLIGYLAGKNALLVLDNCEHLIEGAAALTRAVLSGTKSTSVVATSRESLGLTGEAVCPVAPLALPETTVEAAEDIASNECVSLFVDRAVAADRDFRLTDDISEGVVEICTRLEGLPLAIELAARQLHVLGLTDLRRGLIDHLDLLTAPGEPAARHRTMEAAIEWSYRLLDESLRRMFVALSVFPGTFALEAVDHVCRGLDIDLGSERNAAGAFTTLASRSMVIRHSGGGDTRYRLLEPMRAFARRRAEEERIVDRLGAAHARWVLEFLLEGPSILGPSERIRLRRLAEEGHHFAVAMNWATDHDQDLALELVAAAAEFILIEEFQITWGESLVRTLSGALDGSSALHAAALAKGALAMSESFASYTVAQQWAERALTVAKEFGDLQLRALAETALAVALRSTGELAVAFDRATRAIATFDELGEVVWAAQARRWLGLIELARGNYDDVIARCSEATALWREVGSDWGQGKALWVTAAAHALKGEHDQAEACAGRALMLLEGLDDPSASVHVRAVQGDAARLAGRYEEAERIYRECLRDFQAIGDRRCTASSLKNLGVVALHRGDVDGGALLLTAALDRRLRLGEESGIPEILEGLGLIAHRRKQSENAVTLFAAAQRLRAQSGASAPEVERVELETVLSELRDRLPPDRFEQEWERGFGYDLDQAVSEARLNARPISGSPN
ncbi:MAG: ATP-binding protein [Actinomycetota bacterium]